ncbi:MAG TPA: thioredoxin family protein [Rhizomicrobium sp.]|nr:thioredoxin family protein [Rhizomicrobium sp.]
MRVAHLVFIGAVAMGLAQPALAAKAPTVTSISILAELPTPLPFPYDEKADANKDVDAALAAARAQHKRAFIDLGGNWCGDCRVLAGVMELPEVKAFVNAHYVFVAVDVGRFNRNLQIPARWNMVDALKTGGAPTVLIVDPVTNKVVDAGHTGALEDARNMDPQSIMNWIAEWAN